MHFIKQASLRTLLTLGCLLATAESHAGSTFPAQGRLFAGGNSISPSALNTEMTANGITNYTLIAQFGAEATYAATPWLDVGGRYIHRNIFQTSATNTSYKGTIDQDAILFLARVPIVRSNLLKFDIFAGIGGGNTTFDLISANGTGTLTRKAAAADFYATPTVAAGASAGVGYKSFYFYAEGGYEVNKVSKMTSAGTFATGVTTIDLSGPYVMIGMLFDGVSGHN